MLRPGLSASIVETVTAELTAEALGSGDVPVLATPIVLALAERAAVAAVAGALDPATTTVGVRAEVEHSAPTPVGGTVKATVRLASVEGRRLTFAFEVADTNGRVARGTHVRAVVDRGGFEERARSRA